MNQRLRKKSLALKANSKNKEPKSDSKSSISDEDSGEFSMFTRRFCKFLKKEGKSFRKSSSSNRKSLKTNPAPAKKPEKLICYNCRKSGHIQTECPETVRVRSSKLKGKKTRAMICTWSDESDDEEEDEDSTSEEEDKKSKLCLMAIGDQEIETEVSSSFDDYSLSD